MTQKKVLIVMDGLVIAGYMRAALAEEGIETDILGARGFLDRLTKGEPFDGVVFETHIPHGPELEVDETDDGCYTGVVLYRKLQERHPGKPVVFLSEHAFNDRFNIDPGPHVVIIPKLDGVPSVLVDTMKQLLAATP